MKKLGGTFFDALACLYSGTKFEQMLIHMGNLIFAYFPSQSRLKCVYRLGKQVGLVMCK